MVDIVGVLGEATTATAGTTTVYTVPAGKAARCKIMWSGEAHASTSTGDLDITVNGIIVAQLLNLTATNIYHSSEIGLIIPSGGAVPPSGATNILTVAPATFEYYLAAADTITYTIGTLTMVSMNMQVVGAEIDVT